MDFPVSLFWKYLGTDLGSGAAFALLEAGQQIVLLIIYQDIHEGCHDKGGYHVEGGMLLYQYRGQYDGNT